MRQGLVSFVRRHQRSVGRSAAFVAGAVACAALVAGLQGEGRPAQARPRAPGAAEARHSGGRAAPARPLAPAPARAAWGGAVHGALALSHGALPVGAGPSTFYAMLTVGTDPARGPSDRAPVSFVLVVDRSGSMGGTKIEEAKAAAASLVRSLRPDDELALVAYDDTSRLLVERGMVARVRERALAAIAELGAEGGTAIGPALELGRRTLEGSSSDRVRRIVLVSDGRDESGMATDEIVAIASAASRTGVSVSTLGIGTDYAELLMTRIADASRGNYHYVRSPSQLAGILALELGQMVTTVANDVTAQMTLPEGVELVRTTGADATRVGRRVGLSLGSLFAGDERRVVLELRAEPRNAGPFGTLALALRWTARGSGSAHVAPRQSVAIAASADPGVVQARIAASVLEEGLEVAAVARHEAARVAWQSGDASAARRLEEDNLRRLQEENRSLGSGAIEAQVREYSGALGDMMANDAQSNAGADIQRRITVSNRSRAARDLGTGVSW